MPIFVGDKMMSIPSRDDTKLPLSGGTMTGDISYTMYGSTQIPLKIYGGDVNGQGLLIGAGGATIIGSGESATNLASSISATNETTIIASDNNITFYTKCQDIANKVGIILDSSRNLYPDAANSGNLGTSSNRWSNAYLSAVNTTGTISSSKTTTTYLEGSKGTAIINSTASAGAYTTIFKTNSNNGRFTMSNYQSTLLVGYQTNTSVNAGTNGLTKQITLLNESGNSSFPGDVGVSGRVTAGTLTVQGHKVFIQASTPSGAVAGDIWIDLP